MNYITLEFFEREEETFDVLIKLLNGKIISEGCGVSRNRQSTMIKKISVDKEIYPDAEAHLTISTANKSTYFLDLKI